MDKNCEMCGTLMKNVTSKKRFCPECYLIRRRKSKGIYYIDYDKKIAPVEIKYCLQCGKKIPARVCDGRIFCNKICREKWKKEQNKQDQVVKKARRIRRHSSDIVEIEKRVCGQVAIPRHVSNYRDAKRMFYHAYDNGNAAVLIWVNGVRLTTIPQIDDYFRIDKNKGRWFGDVITDHGKKGEI